VPVVVRVCVSGAPRSAPSHRDAVTYSSGQRKQPCKTACVLRGVGAELLPGGVDNFSAVKLFTMIYRDS